MAAKLEVVPVHSSVQGRIRYRVKGLYHSRFLKDHLEMTLSREGGIRSVKASHLTGTLLIQFNSNRSTNDIESLIKRVIIQGADNPASGNGIGSVIDIKEKKEIIEKRSSTRKKILLPKKLLKELASASALEPLGKDWHLKDVDEVLRVLSSDRQIGLTEDSYRLAFKKYGPNVLPEAVPRSGLSIFLGQLKSVPVALLTVASGISILTGGIMDAVAIMCVVAINAMIGYVTESKAERTINSLKSLIRPTALVVREEKVREVGAEEIVPGDILILRPGSYVPADARIIQATRLSIDESTLTGESHPVSKTEAVLFLGEDHPVRDRKNMCYMGTLIIGGQGIAVAVATGRFTEIGRIQMLVGEARPPDTPMERQLDRMGTQLVIFSAAICGIVFILGLLRGYGFFQMLKTSISLAVAAVPEGLPTVATTTLALGVRDMRRHKVLIRRLESIEALGAVQVICLDKTGTITENRMKVAEIRCGYRKIEASQELNKSYRDIARPAECFLSLNDELLGLMMTCALCNESEVIKNSDSYVLQGTPTENALIYLTMKSGIDILDLKKNCPRTRIIHRSEQRNYMTTFHKLPTGRYLCAIKGAPSEVLSICKMKMENGEVSDITDDDRLRIRTYNERMAGRALRVLGVAYALMDEECLIDDDKCQMPGLVWLGLVGMSDPIRQGVKELIARFHTAGIKTIMITGDQSPTAFAVGKELNISGEDKLVILDSSNISSIEPEAFKALAQKTSIFSRVSPSNKLEIVKALQSAGKVVAMTGDGVNDGPALRVADIGIAMGGTGTDVAREVSDVVIEDDNLETMIVAVERGRTIYENVRKSLNFLLSTNMSEIMVSFTSNVLDAGQPLTEMQLLWINLVTDIFPGLALSMEEPEKDIIKIPPRDPSEPILRREDIHRISREAAVISASALASYSYGIARYGIGPNASALSFLSLISAQLLHGISCRSAKHTIFDHQPLPPNRYLNLAMGGSFALQAIAFFLPGLRSLLGIGSIGITDALVAGGFSVLPLFVNETIKKSQRSQEQ